MSITHFLLYVNNYYFQFFIKKYVLNLYIMSNFRNKYLKYKSKYLQLKNQFGGKYEVDNNI